MTKKESSMSASDAMGTEQTEPKQIEEVVSALKVVHDYDKAHPKELRIFDESQLTDVGNARRLVEHHGKDIHYVSAWRVWMHWNGKIWERLDEDKQGYPQLLKEWAKEVGESYRKDADIITNPTLAAEYRKHAKKCESDSKIRAMLNLITGERGIMVSYEVFDVKPFLFTCQNGTLDLETGKLYESQRKDYLTKLSPVTFDPNATCETWVAFLNRIMLGQPDMVDYLQNLGGQCLTGEVREKAFWILWGAGGDNGKTTYVEEIQYILGIYAQTIPIAALIRDNRGGIPVDLHTLMGARAAFASEPDIGDELTSGQIKRITGKDTMKTRTLNEKPSQWKAQFKLVISTNNKPKITDPSDAMWGRVKCVPFSEKIPEDEQDKDLWKKLEAESSGILNWLISGCHRWLKEGMKEPLAISSAVQDYREESDKLSDWFEYCFDKDIEGFVPFKIYYPLYKLWCSHQQIRPVYDITLKGMLRDRGYVIERGTYMNENGKKVQDRGAFGFKLKSWLSGINNDGVTEIEQKGKMGVFEDSEKTPRIKLIIQAIDDDYEGALRQFRHLDSEMQVDSIQSVICDSKVTTLSSLSLQSKPHTEPILTTNTTTVFTVLSVYSKGNIRNHIENRYKSVDKSMGHLGLHTLIVEEVVNELDLGKYDDSYDVVEGIVTEYLNPPEASQRDFIHNVRECIGSHQNDTQNGAELATVLSGVEGSESKIMYAINQLKSQGEIMELGTECYKVV